MTHVTFRFFSLGGVLLERFSDPEAPGGTALLPARFFLADPWESPDGLGAEMARRLPPERRIPWISLEKREQAIGSLSARNLGPDAAAYIRSTPAYEGNADLYEGDE